METEPNRTLEGFRPSPRNPRKVTKRQLAMLKQALKAFGDLGGIIANRRTGHFVGGHQRMAVFNAEAKRLGGVVPVKMVKEYIEPTSTGTVAEGYIEVEGERYSYREVSWDENTEALANIAANKSAGSFDSVELAATLQTLSKSNLDLTLSMFDAEELRSYVPDMRVIESMPSPEALFGDGPAPERVHGATKPGDGPHADAPEEPAMRAVALYFRPPDHTKFVELIEALKEVYNRSNTSDVVLEAVKRASVKAAFT